MGNHEVWFMVGEGGEGGHVQIPWQFHCVGNTIISLRSVLYRYQIQTPNSLRTDIIILVGACTYMYCSTRHYFYNYMSSILGS